MRSLGGIASVVTVFNLMIVPNELCIVTPSYFSIVLQRTLLRDLVTTSQLTVVQQD
jgi:hypothetical protein